MSDEPKKRPRVWISWALVVVLVLYPLSIGPAYRFGGDDQLENIGTVYTPLWWLYRRVACVEYAMDWYIEKWLGRDGPD
jgi:hypothetical protein